MDRPCIFIGGIKDDDYVYYVSYIQSSMLIGHNPPVPLRKIPRKVCGRTYMYQTKHLDVLLVPECDTTACKLSVEHIDFLFINLVVDDAVEVILRLEREYDKLAAEASRPFLKKNFTLPKLEKAELFGHPTTMKEIERAFDPTFKFPLIDFSLNDSRTFNSSVLMNFAFPKYEFTGETKRTNGRTVGRIRAARNIYLPAPNPKQKPILFVKKGALGGWLEKEENLSQVGTCWVGENAVVMDDAQVWGNAYVYGRALVCGNARVREDAIVCGHAKISQNAAIGGHAYIHGDAWVDEHAKVFHNANVGGQAWIGDHAIIAHDCTITGRVVICGSFTYEGVTRE